MNSRKTIGLCAAILAALPFAQARGQSSGPIAPMGPMRQLPVPVTRNITIAPSAADSGAQAQDDTHTLSSIEMLGIGSLGAVRSFLDPSFRFSQSVDTAVVPGARDSVSSMGMRLTFSRNGSRSQLTGAYDGEHVFYYPDSLYNTTHHNLSVSQEIRWARWVLRLHDDFVLSPEAPFGGLDTGAGAQIAAQSSAGASDTILTQRAKRLNDTASGEVNYFLSRRSIMTFAGSYAVLHFTNSGFINTHTATGRVGYDYAIAPRDSVGLIYDYARTSFRAGAPALQTDTAQLAYGHRVTGRLALQVAAGPQLLRSASTRILAWSLFTAATYQTRRAQYSLSYTHGTSAGSGVFAGSQNHTASGSFHYSLTRLWSASIGGGYAFNQALTPVPGVNGSFGNWFGSAGLGREVGRHLQFELDYRYQQQNAGSGACPISACGPTQSRQVLGMAIQWHPWSLAQ